MAPNVDGLVVQHEERLANLPRTVEVNPVAPLYVFVVNQMLGGRLNVTDKGLQLDLP